MRESQPTPRPAVLGALALLLAGCSTTSSWLDRVWAEDEEIDEAPLSPESLEADDYLRELDLLSTGDPATQAEILADAEIGAKLTPGPSTNLRYALALATPGHDESNMQVAHSMLRELLAETALMTPAEIALAHIYLNSVEERLTLESETRRLRESARASESREERALAQRLANVEAENRQLRGELADAEEKLEAITTIERSIREQGQ